MSTLSGAVTTLIEGGFRTQLDSALLTTFLMKKLSTRLRSKWGKYVTKLPKDTPPDAVAFRDFIWKVYEQETAGQLVTELTKKTDPPSDGKGAAKRVADKRTDGGGVHAVADHVRAPPKQLLAIEGSAAAVPFVRPPKCPCLSCGGAHLSRDCAQFKLLGPNQRQMLVLQRRYCYACLHQHTKRDCKWVQKCSVLGCTMVHHPLLHGSNFRVVYDEYTRDRPSRSGPPGTGPRPAATAPIADSVRTTPVEIHAAPAVISSDTVGAASGSTPTGSVALTGGED